MAFARPLDKGIGIHFTAYELVGELHVPELFLITNYCTPNYERLHEGGVQATRRTWHKIAGGESRSEHGGGEHRLCVHRYLYDGGRLLFYNADSKMFYTAADAVRAIMNALA